MADSDTSFGVLGPLTVAQAGRSIAIGGRKERRVLAQLLARANAVVSVDALVEGVWNGSPPRSAERTLQAYVARLRRAIEPARESGASAAVLVTDGVGYRLKLATGQLDALRFEQLARQGVEQLRRGDSGASRTLREALELWRGDAYAEFEDVDSCGSEARRLAELRLVALEDRLDADLAAGGASELVPELELLVAGHPFRERIWGQLMLALYRAGRQADALAAYRRARAVLTEELGLEPGPELRRLEAAILAQDPDLDRARAATWGPLGALPAPLAAIGPAFVGRAAELAWLRAAWAQAAEGRGGFVSVLGPEGIGKTRLVAELAHAVHDGGAIVLYGRCDHAHRGPRGLLDQTLRSGGSSLAELDGAEVPLTDLAGAVARFLPGWAAHRPVLIVLDDLHLADSDTLEVVADLASWSEAEAMLVVAAFRTDAAGGPVSESGTGDTAAQVTLGGLNGDEVAELCAVYDSDGWTPADIGRLHELTRGVPLQVHEQASEWARRRAVDRVEVAADRSTAARLRLAVSRGEMADSVEGIQRLLEQRRANLAAREAELAAPGVEVCPYKGLAAFESADAANFYGRERLVAELVARLAGARLLAVIGPSGSGKSSVVRAGLLPALDAGVVPVTDGWSSVILTPGADPARTLFRRLAAARAPTGRRAVFIDQFEEAFTFCTDETAQAQFVDQVVELCTQDDTVVILALRADHVGHCAAHPTLAELISGNQVLVGPMREAELRRAIELPARRAGLTIEPGLVDVIVSDVAGRPGALPLLSTALAETWERRTDRTLTLAGYSGAGGVNGALARLAEDAYLALGDDTRAAARRVLLRLSDAGDDGTVDLRRRLPLGEVVGGDEHADVAVEALVARRLLTVDGDSVEVAHEALLREWPRLSAWLDEDVQGRRVHRHLADAARSWRAAGEDPSELYRGTRLDAALDWAGTHATDLNEAELAFLDAGRHQAEHEVADARRRAAEKARANRRLRALLGGIGALLVLALVSGLLFLRQRNRAEETSLETRARELASESTVALDEDPELGILLALEAVDTTGEPLPEAIGALQRAVQASRVELRGDDGAENVVFTRDGRLLITDSLNRPPVVIVRDATTGAELRRLMGPSGRAVVGGLDLSPDGRLLAASYHSSESDVPAVAVVLWDVESGREEIRLLGPSGKYALPAFSPDGRLVAAIRASNALRGMVVVWDATSGDEWVSFEVPFDGAGSVLFADDSTLLVAERERERVGIYSVDDGRELGALPTPGFEPQIAALDAAGERLALTAQFSPVQLWDLPNRRLLRTIPVDSAYKVDWSADGERLALSSAEATVRIVDPESGAELLTLRGHQIGSNAVAFAPDGEHLASVAPGELRIWDVTPDGAPELGGVTLPARRGDRLFVSPDGSEVMVAGDGAAHFVATGTGASRTLDGQLVSRWSYFPTPSPDWRWVGSVEEDGRPRVSAVDTLASVIEPPACTSPVAFSPDRSLVVLDGIGPCSIDSDLPSFEAPPGAVLRSRVVEAGSGREVLDLGDRLVYLGSAVFDPSGSYLAVNVVGQRTVPVVELYDVGSGERVERFNLTNFDPEALAFDPQGRWLAVTTSDGGLWVFDVAAIVDGTHARDAVIMRRVAHETGVGIPTMNADGIVATAGYGDGLIRLWDRASGELAVELRYASQGFAALAFDPNGRDLLYAVDDVVHRYPLDNDELIALARDRLTRELTAEECAHYLDADRCS